METTLGMRVRRLLLLETSGSRLRWEFHRQHRLSSARSSTRKQAINGSIGLTYSFSGCHAANERTKLPRNYVQWKDLGDLSYKTAVGTTTATLVKLNGGPDSLDDSPDWTGIGSNVQTAGDALAEWRNARTRADQKIVDWGRYHLQVMFVDRSHRIRARLAEGLFARIASWNGVGLSLYPQSCGMSPREGEVPSVVLQAEARRLGIGGHVFSAASTSFDRSDLDTYDLIVAVDISVRDDILLVAAQQPSLEPLNYEQKVRLLGEFSNYGMITMLEDDLQEKVECDLTDARTTLEIYPTYMSQYKAWRTMVATITLSSAGLVRFLMDAYPENLPDYDPVD